MADERKREHGSGHKHDHDHRKSHGHEHEHGHGHDHGQRGHEHTRAADHERGHSHGHPHGEHRAHEHSHHDHEHAHDHDHEHVHGHDHGHSHDHGHGNEHAHEHKTRFHDPAHAAEFDRRSTISSIRASLTEKLIEMLTLKGRELILDLATGTGRVARPLSKQIKDGRIVGVDQALAMLDVGHRHEDPIGHYVQSAGEADKLPFKTNTFDRAFVSFSLHHFGNASGVVGEVLRVLKNSGRFVVLDPILEEAKDSVDIQLETKINQVFRRTHGDDFRFHTSNSIQRLLTKAGYRVPRCNVLSFSFNQEGMDGIPTGRHWLEAALELEKEAPELAERMKKNYFTWHAHGDHVHVKGSFSYALITGVKPA
jgi:ubiquinone/menaquinone biosynthesis C-methylase UbiE